MIIANSVFCGLQLYVENVSRGSKGDYYNEPEPPYVELSSDFEVECITSLFESLAGKMGEKELAKAMHKYLKGDNTNGPEEKEGV